MMGPRVVFSFKALVSQPVRVWVFRLAQLRQLPVLPEVWPAADPPDAVAGDAAGGGN